MSSESRQQFPLLWATLVLAAALPRQTSALESAPQIASTTIVLAQQTNEPEQPARDALPGFTVARDDHLGLPTRVAALLMGSQMGGRLALTLLATPLQGTEETARVADSTGRVLSEGEAPILERRESAFAGVEAARTSITTPNLDPGLYELTVSASGPSADGQLDSSIPIIVGTGEGVSTWANLDDLAAREEAPPERSAAQAKSGRCTAVQRLTETYLAFPGQAGPEGTTETGTASRVDASFLQRSNEAAPSQTDETEAEVVQEPTEDTEPEAPALPGITEFTVPSSGQLGLPARVAALLMSGQQGGELPLVLLAMPLQATEETLRVAFVIDVDASQLPLEDAGPSLPLELYVYAVTERGAVGGHLAQALSLPNTSALTERGGVKLLGEIESSPRPRLLRVLLRHSTSGRFGLREGKLTADGTTISQAFVSPPVMADSRDSWVLGRVLARESQEPRDPFTLAGEPILPATRPLLATETQTLFWLLAQGLNPTADQVTTRVLNSSGEVLGEEEAPILEREESSLAGVEAVRTSVNIPTLDPGLYELAVSVPGLSPDTHLHSTIPIIIGVPETVAAWTELDTLAPQEQPAPLPAVRRRQSRRREPQEVTRKAYVEALGKLAGGDPTAARRAVAELEEKLLERDGSTATAQLAEAELRVAKELTRRDSECLLALAFLHSELFLDYSSSKANVLKHHSKLVVGELATLLANNDKSQLARSLAANIAVNVAGTLMDQHSIESAEALYRRALSIEPTNEAALVGLATSRERTGGYEQARDLLETLVQEHPNNAEGRLRLAINRVRLGDRTGGRSLLERCAAGDNPAWIRSLAYQELARGRIESDNLEEAHQLLLLARDELPDDPTLTIQHAYVLDRMDRPFESRTLVNGLSVGTQDRRVSPRLRYATGPTRELAEARRALTGHTTHAYSTLERVVTDVIAEKEGS